MADELKPCPFCGIDVPDWCDDGGGEWHYIQCRDCEGATGRYHKTKDEAIAAWNRRSPENAALLAVAEAFEEAAKQTRCLPSQLPGADGCARPGQPCQCCLAAARLEGRAKALRATDALSEDAY